MPQQFLLVDHNTDGRLLLRRTLARQFPDAAFHEADTSDAGFALATKHQPSVVILHRTLEYDGPTLVALFRRLEPRLLIILVSGRDLRAEALAAGANAFLNYDAWLRIGAVVNEVLAAVAPGSTPPWTVGDHLGEAVPT